MKKPFLLILVFVFSVYSYGFHTDKVFYKNFGNVKALVQTAWDNYGATIDVEIAAKLANELSKKLGYKDTIVLEFRHDYTMSYPKIKIVENGNSENVYLMNRDLRELYKNQQKYNQKAKSNSICIRQMDKQFDIWGTLKLIEYCIKNKVKEELVSIKFKDPFPNKFFYLETSFYSLSPELINEIEKSEKSETLRQLTKKEIDFINLKGIKGTYTNEQYNFKSINKSYKTNTLMYLLELEKGVCVFDTTNSFVYLNDSHKVKKHLLNSKGHYPFYADKVDRMRAFKKIENGILLYRLRDINVSYIFSEEKNEILDVIEY